MSERQAKRIRRQMNRVLGNRARQVWASLTALPLGKRLRLAWMLARGKGARG